MSTCDDGLPSEGRDGVVQIGSMIFYICSRLSQVRPRPIDHVDGDTCSQLNSEQFWEFGLIQVLCHIHTYSLGVVCARIEQSFDTNLDS